MFSKLRKLVWLLMLGDLLLSLVALVLSDFLRRNLPFGLPLGSNPSYLEIPLYLFVAVIWPLVFQASSAYQIRNSSAWVGDAGSLLLAVATSIFAFAGALYFTYRDVPRLMVGYFFLLDLAVLALWRLLLGLGMAMLRRRGGALIQVLVVGGGESLNKVVWALTAKPVPGVQLVGVVAEGPSESFQNVLNVDGLEDVPHLVETTKVDEVILAFPAADFVKTERLAYALLPLPVRVRLVPDFMRLVVARSSVDSLAGVPLIGLREPVIQGLSWVVKRVFDLGASLLGVLVLWPLMAIIGVLIRLDSPGRILFRQKRVGENGKVFTICKYRTMREGSDRLFRGERDESGRLFFKAPDDPRVTRIGRFLRRTSLDELPNLFNVLKGDMSLVGPRPELLPIAETYEPWQRQRLAVLPGMTGWWQVSGRSDLPLHMNTEYDLYYVRNYSLWLDIKILFKTVRVVLQGKGAY